MKGYDAHITVFDETEDVQPKQESKLTKQITCHANVVYLITPWASDVSYVHGCSYIQLNYAYVSFEHLMKI